MTILVYKMFNKNDRSGIMRAIESGYIAVAANGELAAVNGENVVEAKPRIGKRRRPPRRIGPAPKKSKAVRDSEIRELRAGGWTNVAIGRRYNISAARVSQILAQARTKKQKERKQ